MQITGRFRVRKAGTTYNTWIPSWELLQVEGHEQLATCSWNTMRGRSLPYMCKNMCNIQMCLVYKNWTVVGGCGVGWGVNHEGVLLDEVQINIYAIFTCTHASSMGRQYAKTWDDCESEKGFWSRASLRSCTKTKHECLLWCLLQREMWKLLSTWKVTFNAKPSHLALLMNVDLPAFFMPN